MIRCHVLLTIYVNSLKELEINLIMKAGALIIMPNRSLQL